MTEARDDVPTDDANAGFGQSMYLFNYWKIIMETGEVRVLLTVRRPGPRPGQAVAHERLPEVLVVDRATLETLVAQRATAQTCTLTQYTPSLKTNSTMRPGAPDAENPPSQPLWHAPRESRGVTVWSQKNRRRQMQ